MVRLYVAGIGPGNNDNMTAACRDCLNKAEIIVSYSSYIELLRPLFPDKIYIETGMTKEIDRCKTAVELAKQGKRVCLVSSGDAGVYGMASPALLLTDIEIKIIPGITAALSGGALLGAPLANDFAVISLSDALTPWDIIEKRLQAAAAGDFVICLYNPGSAARANHLSRACDILLKILPETRICGVVSHIGQDGEAYIITTLKDLKERKTNMSETIFIGNQSTCIINNRMVTPRGYV